MGTEKCLASKNLGIPSHKLMSFRYNLLTQKYGEEMVESKFGQIPFTRNKRSTHLITKNIVESEESLSGLGLAKPIEKEWFQVEDVPVLSDEIENRTQVSLVMNPDI